jgi:hypothetical protein
MLQAILGLRADGWDRTFWLRPSLPEWLGAVRVRRLKLAGQIVEFDVLRENGQTRVELLETGGLQAVVERIESK